MAAPFSNTAGAKPGTMIGGLQWGTTGMDADATAATPRGLTCIGPWSRANVASSTASFLYSGQANITGISMPKGGSVLGWAVNIDPAPSAGSGTLTIFKNGTAGGGIFTAQTISAQTKTAFITNLSSLTFARGDTFKARLSTNAAWATTPEVAVYLWTT